MEIIKSIIIAIIQGITEFLPISSSGHILLLKQLLNFEIDSNMFDIVVHFGTLISVIVFFRVEIAELVVGVFKSEIKSKLFGETISRGNVLRSWGCLIIGVIPAGIVGLLLDDVLGSKFATMSKVKFLLLGAFFCLTGIILLSTLFIKKKNTNDFFTISIKQSVIVGLFQALAILPGVSRSGTTISAGLVSGISKKDAGRFSFLLSIPLIFAAFFLKIIKVVINGEFSDINTGVMISGFLVSAIVGYFSLKFLFKILSSDKFWTFSIYMILPAITSFVLFFVA